MQQQGPAEDSPLYRYRFGNAEFDEARRELRVDGAVVDLEQRPLQVLAALLHCPGEVVPRETLFDTVWAGRPTVDNVLANAVAKLRKALGAEGGTRIHTLPRVGYRLNGPVERTVAGRRSTDDFGLRAGQPVPGREHFRLSEQLGPAAGNQVWLARHDKTGEPRVYKFGGGGERLAALKREVTLCRVLREHLGQRDDLVHVIDWHFDTPPFHIECEYGGLDLAQWAQDGARLESATLPQRLALFLQIVDAVAAAHSAGVLHKDLKPTNILVAPRGGDWQVRVADFGSGRLLEPGRLEALGITRLGLTVTEVASTDTGGTLLYLAPELLSGGAPTARSDIYALGLILFQLAVGDLRRPLAPGWEQDIGDELLREDIAAATDGNPARRLGSAAELGERLRSRDVRVAERRRVHEAESRALAAERLLDRGRARRPWIVAALLLLLVGLGTSLWQYRNVRQARDEARQQAAIADATNRFLNEDLLGAGIGGNSPAWYERNPTLREILDAAAQRLDRRFAGGPLLLADLHQTLGRAYRSTGDFASAAQQLQSAVDLLQHAAGAGDERSVLLRYELATVLAHLSHFKEAQVLLDRADADAGARLHAVSMIALRSHMSRGNVLYQQLRAEPALAEYRSANNLQRLLRPDDASMSAHLLLSIAGCQLRLGQPREAETIARRILAGAPYTQARVGLSTLAAARSRLGDALRGQGRYAEAIPVVRQALAGYEQSRGSDSQGAISTLSTLGYLYSLTGDEARALDMQRDVYQRSLHRWGPDSQYTLIELLNLGSGEYDTGDLQQALVHLQAASRGLVKVSGEDSPVVQAAHVAEANALSDLGRQAEALALIEHVDARAYQATTSDPGRAVALAAYKARILVRMGRPDGVPQLRQAIARMEAAGLADNEVAAFRKELTAATHPR